MALDCYHWKVHMQCPCSYYTEACNLLYNNDSQPLGSVRTPHRGLQTLQICSLLQTSPNWSHNNIKAYKNLVNTQPQKCDNPSNQLDLKSHSQPRLLPLKTANVASMQLPYRGLQKTLEKSLQRKVFIKSQ